jgi:hypothetical protein
MLVIVGLVIAFVIVAMVARQTRATRHCRWRPDRSGDRAGQHKYRCAACGAETFCTTDTPPDRCLAPRD